MRPARRIILVGENDDLLAPLRFVLSHSQPGTSQACYHITTCFTEAEAIEAIRNRLFDLLLIQAPLKGIESLLSKADEIHSSMKIIVLIKNTNQEPKGIADVVLLWPKMDDLLLRIKVLTQRKRGPRKGHKRSVKSEMGESNNERKDQA
jgi:DNA-binding response OmpR family regulator